MDNNKLKITQEEIDKYKKIIRDLSLDRLFKDDINRIVMEDLKAEKLNIDLELDPDNGFNESLKEFLIKIATYFEDTNSFSRYDINKDNQEETLIAFLKILNIIVNKYGF